MERFSRNLLLSQNARIREKEAVSIQVEDVAWQVDRSVAGVENGRVERHHGVESAHKERETREGETTRFDSLFRLFLLRRHSFRSTLRMTTISFVSEFIDASGGSSDRYCSCKSYDYELHSTNGYLAVTCTMSKSRNLFSLGSRLLD